MTQDDKRQRLIVKQSQMERVIEYCQMMDIKPSSSDLFAMVSVFTDFIFDKEGIMDKAKAMDSYLEKEYKG